MPPRDENKAVVEKIRAVIADTDEHRSRAKRDAYAEIKFLVGLGEEPSTEDGPAEEAAEPAEETPEQEEA